MDDLIVEEIHVFLEAAGIGMIMAAVYDILRIIRKIIRHRNWFVGIEDYLFWIGVGIFSFAMMFQWNDGIVRGYVIFTLVLGAYLYHAGFSPWVVEIGYKIFDIIFTLLLKKPLKCFRIIITRIWKMVKIPFGKLVVWERTVVEGVKKNYEKCNDKKKEKGKTCNTGH